LAVLLAHGGVRAQQRPAGELAQERPLPELDPEHPITIVKSADSDLENPDGPRHNEVVKFVCGSCGNGDEDVFEIIHDENGTLARDDGTGLTCRESVRTATTEGGRDERA
jgi:hypothetical protein